MATNQTFIYEIDLTIHKVRKVTMDDFELNTDDKKIYWFHSDLNNTAEFEEFAKRLKLPPKVIEYCHEEEQRSRLYESHFSVSVKIQCLLENKLEMDDKTSVGNLLIHLTDNFCFTASRDYIEPIEILLDSLDNVIQYAKTPCFILFLLFDNSINEYSHYLYEFELLAENIELSNSPDMYNNIVVRKTQVMKVKRYSIAIMHILMHISSRKIHVISDECQKSLSNLLNNIRILSEESESIREILQSKLDQINNSLMQEANGTMRILTSVAAIFLPLTLIAGIYGMNFVMIPELHWTYGYPFALGLMVFVASSMAIHFKRKKWF